MRSLRGTTVTRVINYKSWVVEVMKKDETIKILCNRYSSVINHFTIKGTIIFSLSFEIFLMSYFFHDKNRSIGYDEFS